MTCQYLSDPRSKTTLSVVGLNRVLVAMDSTAESNDGVKDTEESESQIIRACLYLCLVCASVS